MFFWSDAANVPRGGPVTRGISRRRHPRRFPVWARWTLPVFAASALVLGGMGCEETGKPGSSESAEVGSSDAVGDAALRLHHEALVIDTHADTTPRFEDPSWRFDQRHSEGEGHVDLPRMREGGLDVQFWSIYLGKPAADGLAIREALQRIDAVHQLVARHPEDLALAGTVEEIRRHAGQGRVVSLMGIEGGHIIEEDLAALRNFYRLGARYMTLTHSFHTGWADSSGTRTDLEPLHHGLTPFGEEVVREMNRLGMMVDVSHVSDETFWDVLEITRAPVIASHSSVRGVADHRRNLDDAMLRGLARNGGVIMINFYPAYIDEAAAEQTTAYFERWQEPMAAIRERTADDPRARRIAYRTHFQAHPVPQASLEVLLDHFDHALRVAGPDHVGIGADWDGVASMPSGMQDVSELPSLTRGLLARGHAPETVRKVLGENLLRVMTRVEEVAEKLAGASKAD